MTQARCVQFCDQAVGLIAGWWPEEKRCSSQDKVERVYLPVQTNQRTGVLQVVDKVEDLAGRKVFVFPGGFGEKEMATRGTNLNWYEVYVAFAEVWDRNRFAAGLPLIRWCDERVLFAEGLYDLLNVSRKDRPAKFTGAIADAWADAAEVMQSFDPTELREKNVFWSLLKYTYVMEVDG